MEENEVMLLKNSKMYVTRVGRWMNVFSILSVIVMLLLAAGGIVMLFVSNMLDESTPYYLDNILGLTGVGVIIGAGAIIPAVVYMRRAVRSEIILQFFIHRLGIPEQNAANERFNLITA